MLVTAARRLALRRAPLLAPHRLLSTAKKDLAALDAYSSTVIGVVQQVGDSVVAINVQGSGGAGSGDSAGSGVILSPDGYVLTNAHVVGDAASVKLALTDGRDLRATVRGRDVATDLALLQADQGGLPFASLGNSNELLVGQLVVAIGNPLGARVLSARNRTLLRATRRCLSFVDAHHRQASNRRSAPAWSPRSGAACEPRTAR